MPIRKEKALDKNLFDAIFSVIKNRRSVRSYSASDVSDDLINKILLAASYAPSAGNQQPWEFFVVRNFELRKHLTQAAFNQQWMLQAPVFIVVAINMKIASATYGERGEKLYGTQSTAAAIQNMLLIAESLGLSTCWVGAFNEPRVAILLHCPEHIRPCAIITLGYSEEKPEMPFRQKLEDVVHHESFGKTQRHRKISEK